jgi:hypothetical protein
MSIFTNRIPFLGFPFFQSLRPLLISIKFKTFFEGKHNSNFLNNAPNGCQWTLFSSNKNRVVDFASQIQFFNFFIDSKEKAQHFELLLSQARHNMHSLWIIALLLSAYSWTWSFMHVNMRKCRFCSVFSLGEKHDPPLILDPSFHPF